MLYKARVRKTLLEGRKFVGKASIRGKIKSSQDYNFFHYLIKNIVEVRRKIYELLHNFFHYLINSVVEVQRKKYELL